MTVQFIGAQGNAGTTVTIPAHQAGDFILLFAYRDGNQSPPTTPTAAGTVPTWTLIGSSGANSNSSNFRYAIATGSTTTSGTWTSATEIICLVYRGARIGTFAGGSGTATTTVSYPALTLQRTDGTSQVVGVAGHRTASNLEIPPLGMINRALTGTEAVGHDTNGGVTSWSLTNVTVNASSAFRSWTVELRDKSLTVLASNGTYSLTGNNATFTTGYTGKNVKTETGVFALSGINANLIGKRQIAASPGSLLLPANNLTVYKRKRGILAFGGPIERLSFNEQIDNAYWFKSNSPTITADAVDGPFAGTKADAMLASATTGDPSITSASIGANTSSTLFTLSCFVKAANGFTGLATLSITERPQAVPFTGDFVSVDFDFSQSNVSGGSTQNGRLTSFSAQNIGNGWYRLAVTGSAIKEGLTPADTYACLSIYAASHTIGRGVYIYGVSLTSQQQKKYGDPAPPYPALRYLLKGNDAFLPKGKKLAAETVTFLLDGKAQTLSRTRRLTAEPGQSVITGQEAVFNTQRRLTGAFGNLAWLGESAGLFRSLFLSAAQGDASLTGNESFVSYRRRAVLTN